MFLHVFCPFSSWIVCLFVFPVEFWEFFIMSLLLDMCLVNIFSHCVVCLFILSTGSFAEKMFLILIRSNISIFLLWILPWLFCLSAFSKPLAQKESLPTLPRVIEIQVVDLWSPLTLWGSLLTAKVMASCLTLTLSGGEWGKKGRIGMLLYSLLEVEALALHLDFVGGVGIRATGLYFFPCVFWPE